MPASTQSKLNFTSKKNVPGHKAITHDIIFRASTPLKEEQKAEINHDDAGKKIGKGSEKETAINDPAQHPIASNLDNERKPEEGEQELFQEEFIEKPRLNLGVDKSLSDRAYEVTNHQIQKYYKDIENSRISTAVHQEGLAEFEKILRHFDLSSQYGPCVGVSRCKRWERAERLGLGPPIEVLAVLLKAGLGEGMEGPPKGWESAPAGFQEDTGSIAYINQLVATHTE
ncbi:hypothetical protein EYR41_003710 [Orbilia oligospora]|uniref:Uncharacterized protein n=1 Tax=Orbilia oligospora TaxID=2813651 RepID=A0A7C8P4C8_ORBOL|nr:hypothetical protein TWF751_002585 [Orbilia oligospora]TGJ71772.1 hypothetical protein EYR41_003710 [Orbilia oligospora]